LTKESLCSHQSAGRQVALLPRSKHISNDDAMFEEIFSAFDLR